MKYDFKTLVKRRDIGSSKWNQMLEKNPGISEEIVPLSVADMELKNPPEIVSGIQKYAGEMIFGYTDPDEKFFSSVKNWMKRRHNWEINSEWIVSTPGVVSGLFFAINAFTKKGDGVIVMPPVYYPFYLAIENNERKVVKNPLLNNNGEYNINFDKLEELAKRPENKILLFCSPHNPVGRVWTEQELRKVGEICNKYNVLMLSDEIHNDIIMPGYTHIVYATLGEEFKNNCIIFTAPSKTFNLAGLQGSNIIIPNEKIRETYKNYIINTTSIARVNMFAYKACEIAYNECEKWLEELILHINNNYKLIKVFIEENLPKIKVTKLEGTYLVWLDFRKYNLHYEKLEEIMEEEANLFLDEGYIFGEEGEGFERINLACPTKVLKNALKRLLDAMNKIKDNQ